MWQSITQTRRHQYMYSPDDSGLKIEKNIQSWVVGKNWIQHDRQLCSQNCQFRIRNYFKETFSMITINKCSIERFICPLCKTQDWMQVPVLVACTLGEVGLVNMFHYGESDWLNLMLCSQILIHWFIFWTKQSYEF